MIGEIRLFAGNYAPTGWAFCDGQSVTAADHPELARLLGSTWGDGGENTVVLPDLRGRAPMHCDRGGSLAEIRTISIAPPDRWQGLNAAIHIHFIIQLREVLWADDDPYVGEVRIFAGDRAHEGWRPCDGEILPVSGQEMLFAVVRRTYTDDRYGAHYFALPDLRARMPVHPAGREALGQIANAADFDDSATKTHLSLRFHIAMRGVFPSPA